MNFWQDRTPGPVPIRDNRPAVIGLLLLGGVLAAILCIALRSPMKDDIAWLLYAARRMLAGHELYIDVIEVNPPLIIWISAIPLALARWVDADPQSVAIPGFVAIILGCVWWSACLLRRDGGLLANRVAVFAAMGIAFLVLPAADLGQREHLLAAAFLPYLILFAQELDGGRARVWEALCGGILAGLGCALKPRYCAAFAALECLALMCGQRPWRRLPLVAGCTLVAYAGLVALVCPAYLEKAVPMALALYGATDVPFSHLLAASAPLMAGEAVAIGLVWLRRHALPHRTLMLTLLTFAVSSTAICFIDGKDWFYHRIPASIATALVLMLGGAEELRRRQWRISPAFAVAACGLLTVSAQSFQSLSEETSAAIAPQQTTVERLEALIRQQHAHSYVAFSEWLGLGFPVVNSTGVAWASRFDSMWALKGEIWRAGFDPAADHEWPVARWVAHDFLAGCPDLAVVDTRESVKYIAVLSKADPAFARAWTRYSPFKAFDGLVVYRRTGGGCRDVWVAVGAKPPTTTR